MSKKNASFVQQIPHVNPPSQETLERLQKMTKTERKRLEKSVSQNMHVQSARKHRRIKKQELTKRWWKDNWIAFLSLIFAFIAAIPVIVQAIESILKLLG